ncbi:MAG: hypothetical protein WBN22_08565 [Verrucomicrobiia bacterium]
MSAIAMHNERLFNPVLKAVIIYDDFDSAARATALLKRVAARTDEAMKWDIKPWRFDVLKQPTLAALTVAVAANADLIVLALRQTHSTPAELLDWLKNWAEHRRIEDAAVMALYSGEPQTLSVPWNQLKVFAEDHGLTLLDSHDVWNGGDSASFGLRWQQRRQSVPPGPARVFAEQLPVPHHWGINE